MELDLVKCEVCGKLMKQITNTHLKKHSITTEEYKNLFPNSKTLCKNLLETISNKFRKASLGRPRPDHSYRMIHNNPMKNPKSLKKMSSSRKNGIINGNINPINNFNHLPSKNELALQSIFLDLKIPLKYVGDGKFWVDGKCPDFVNEELKIVLELEMSAVSSNMYREDKLHYEKNGYFLIYLRSIKREDVLKFVAPWFDNKFGWKKIKRIYKENPKKCTFLYNLEIKKNNNYFANNILVHNCFVQNYSMSLYHSFYDNWKEVGLRYCKPDYFKSELEKHMRFRRCKPNENASDIQKAFHLGIPARLGIRTENFIPIEKKMRIAYEMLKYLSDQEYPVMINTKSNLLKEDDYVRILADNKAGAAVHMTLISSDNKLLKRLEPGAPSFDERLETCRVLIDAGIRVVARIEPFMCFINDDREKVDEYISKIKSVGIKNITLDTYSYSASAPGLRKNFENIGFDFDRMFYVMSELQWMGSLLLTKFMEYLQANELSCSTFDYGSSIINNQNVCCEVGDFFNTGFNYGSTIMAIRFIQSKKGMPVRWKDFEEYVESKGGFLSNSWKRKVQMAWNMIGNIAEVAYFPYWAANVIPIGIDDSLNRIWIYRENTDFRKEMLQSLID